LLAEKVTWEGISLKRKDKIRKVEAETREAGKNRNHAENPRKEEPSASYILGGNRRTLDTKHGARRTGGVRSQGSLS